MKYGFIYITTNLITNKKYLGMKKYTKDWQNYLGSSIPLKQDINKYGVANFKREIIEECKNKEQLQDREIYYLKLYNAVKDPNFYNKSIPHPEFRIKGKTNSSKGRTWEEIYGPEGAKLKREKCKIRGKTWEEIYGPEVAEQKRKKAKEKRSIETRLKISKARKGIVYSEETKRRISEGVKRYNATKKKNIKV
jgi:hypothetical protein